ncbi:thioredoxin-like protein [Cercophora newfieldiana]|uniref:Glutathione S-transferase kappa n=1 Tax=Cercophora newfieldiana TaxID=92897 RepID=A0AA40CTZ2_9PEZI|nr:thioredoxin-like protein [Cercophora newfieldiana]
MPTSQPHITLYIDTVSPFAYLAYHILRNDPLFTPISKTYTPIFLGGLMHKCGNTAPMRILNKDKWINAERLRWARLFGVPMSQNLPPEFPANTLGIMRALCALSEGAGGQGRLTEALDVLFRAYWVEGKRTFEGDVLRGMLAGIFGEAEAERILADAKTVGKAKLLENTDKAFADGAFGLPWMVCTNAKGETEGFWGVDHLGQVAQFMGLDHKGGEKGWKALL